MNIKVTDAFRFDSIGEHGIPQLQRDMLAELPVDVRVETWAGKPTRELTGGGAFWWHNWRNAGEEGLEWKRCIVGFYMDDYKFEQCYSTPRLFLQKLLFDDPFCVATPNYSMWFDDPRAMKIWAAYRARWCGRYWQEHGIKVIPDLQFCTDMEAVFCSEGIPIGAPVVSMQVQTAQLSDDELRAKLRGASCVLERTLPQRCLLYGGRRVEAFAEVIERYGCEVVRVRGHCGGDSREVDEFLKAE